MATGRNSTLDVRCLDFRFDFVGLILEILSLTSARLLLRNFHGVTEKETLSFTSYAEYGNLVYVIYLTAAQSSVVNLRILRNVSTCKQPQPPYEL